MTDTCNHTIPDRTPPRLTRTGPSAVHQDRGVKCATGASSKIRGRDNITIGTWITRTLRTVGKLQELTHEMDRYRWNILVKHQGMDRPGGRQVQESSGEQRKMEETGCEVIGGAPTTLAVKG